MTVSSRGPGHNDRTAPRQVGNLTYEGAVPVPHRLLGEMRLSPVLGLLAQPQLTPPPRRPGVARQDGAQRPATEGVGAQRRAELSALIEFGLGPDHRDVQIVGAQIVDERGTACGGKTRDSFQISVRKIWRNATSAGQTSAVWNSAERTSAGQTSAVRN